jgi:hypothetical protein
MAGLLQALEHSHREGQGEGGLGCCQEHADRNERERDTSAQQLNWDFGNISFKEGESVDKFGIRIANLSNNLCYLGDNITDAEVIKKLLVVVPDRLNQATVSLDMFLDLNNVTVEDMIGRPCVFEERTKPKHITDATGHLMLCEDD